MEKRKILTIGIIWVLFLLIGGIYAKDYLLLCLNKGEVAEFSLCNPRMDDKTCNAGTCQYCTYIGSSGSYCPASINKCNANGLTCNNFGEEPNFDKTPPVITLHYPDQEIYGDKKILINASANEGVKWRYQNLASSESWKSLCTNKLSLNCEKEITLKEGENDITLKATDAADNEGFYNFVVFLDSKKPKIYKTYPKKNEFAGSNFEIQFKEDNPESLTLYYGSDMKKFDIDNDCYLEKGKYYCNKEVNIDKYNGQEIEYYFILEDIAGNEEESKHVEINVDSSEPVLNNPDNFWMQGEGKKNKYIYFNINITEKNFDEVIYSYIDSKGKLKERRLCSSLKEGICSKKKTFSKGDYEITLSVIDEAGNSVGYGVVFDVV